MTPQSPRKRVIAFCTTALGDTLLCTPALEALGRTFDLDVVVHRRQIGLLMGNPAIKLIYPYRNNMFYRFGLALRLRKHEYHRLVVLHSNDDVLKLIKELKYEKGGNCQGWNHSEIKLEALNFDTLPHFIDQRLALAGWAGAKLTGAERMSIFLEPKQWQAGKDWLKSEGLDAGRPLAAMCPGASHSFKCWPPEKFAQVARALNVQGTQVLLIGAGSEQELLTDINTQAGGGLKIAAGLDLRMLAAVLAGCNLLISNCTGPLHMAQAVGAPVLGLYGPTDPEAIGPRGRPHRVLKSPEFCDKCEKKSCPKAECMEALPAEPVLETALEMLGSAPGKGEAA